MGIGNTTAAAAVAARRSRGGEVAAGSAAAPASTTTASPASATPWPARCARIAGVSDPIEVLREVGGAELVAMAAAVVAARQRTLPVVLDGYVVTAAGAAAGAWRSPARSTTAWSATARPSRPSSTARATRQATAARPRHAPRRGIGAMAAVPLVRMACAGITEVPTFAEWFG